MGIADFRDSYPHQLSGGMAQRTALARALVHKPKLLLLDEPFSALDIKTRHRLYGTLLEATKRENITVLMVTHDVNEAVYVSDSILVMTPRPSTIVKQYEVGLPHPRNRLAPEYTNMVETIQNNLKNLEL